MAEDRFKGWDVGHIVNVLQHEARSRGIIYDAHDLALAKKFMVPIWNENAWRKWYDSLDW